MKADSIRILWDSSRLWGIMAWRALRSFGIPCSLVDAQKIAQGSLLGKEGRLLLVPGGNARQKARALGQTGLENIRAWMRSGGNYLGFCGGAGLALSHDAAEDGLRICPWRRRAYPNKLYHLVSGHVIAECNGRKLPLPVWWPGRFEACETDKIDVLARYLAPGPDLWLADLPLASAPRQIVERWQKTLDLDPHLDFQPGQPLVISGRYGSGKYVLSYAHLETPESPAANAWLCSLLQTFGIASLRQLADAWETSPHGNSPQDDMRSHLREIQTRLHDIVKTGTAIGIFFPRTGWLTGWRQGAPGIVCNHLLAMLAMLAELEPGEKSMLYWTRIQTGFCRLADSFLKKAELFIWNLRLEKTLAHALRSKRKNPETDPEQIFGHPMLGGGMAEKMLSVLDRLVLLSQGDSEG